MGDSWRTAMDLRVKVKRIKVVVEYADGDVGLIIGENLRADLRITPAGVPEVQIDLQDPPYIVLPLTAQKLVMEFDPGNSLTSQTRLEVATGNAAMLEPSTRWLYQ